MYIIWKPLKELPGLIKTEILKSGIWPFFFWKCWEPWVYIKNQEYLIPMVLKFWKKRNSHPHKPTNFWGLEVALALLGFRVCDLGFIRPLLPIPHFISRAPVNLGLAHSLLWNGPLQMDQYIISHHTRGRWIAT